MNYQEGRMLLDKARGASKKLARNTVLRLEGETLIVRFWDTDIIRIESDGTYTLNSGGFRTATTKDRFNTLLPAFNIWQDNGLWYIYHAGDNLGMFEDGIQVRVTETDVEIVSKSKYDAEEVEKAKKRIDRMVSRYITAYTAHIMRNGLPEVSDADCWGCRFEAQGHKELMFDHYLMHFRENSFVPTLFHQAFAEVPFGNPRLVWGMMERQIAQGEEPYNVRSVLRKFFAKRKLNLVKAYMAEGEGGYVSLVVQS